jgi:hypothetical protein
VGSFEPNYEGSLVVWSAGGAPSAAGSHKIRARAGHHLTPQQLASGRNVYEELGEGFTLFAFGASESQVSDFAAAASRLGAPLRIVRDDGADLPAAYGAKLVLVRPDQFIAWAGEEASPDAETILARAIGLQV